MAAVSSFLETTTTSAFLGTTLPSGQQCTARVTMGVSVQSLKSKPLALLRVLARQQGVKGLTKDEIIAGLSGLPTTVRTPSYTPSTSFSYSEPASSSSESELQTKPLSELRALAKSLGVRGDTRAEIIKLILAAGPAPSASTSYSAPTYSAPASASSAGPALPRAALERKSLMELRAMARIRGIFVGSKQELIRHLSTASTPRAATPAPAAPAYSAPVAAPSYSNGAAVSNGAASTGTSKVAAVRQLAAKSLAQLRAMAAQRGVRGATKDELVRQLAAVM